MSKAAKILEQMKSNPRDWQIDQIKSVADAHGIAWRLRPGSHVLFRHPNGRAKLSIPAHRPIKPIYVQKFLKMIEEGVVK